MSVKRNRRKHDAPLEVRLAEEAARLRAKAHHVPAGAERQELFKKARQMEEAMQLTERLAAPPPLK